VTVSLQSGTEDHTNIDMDFSQPDDTPPAGEMITEILQARSAALENAPGGCEAQSLGASETKDIWGSSGVASCLLRKSLLSSASRSASPPLPFQPLARGILHRRAPQSSSSSSGQELRSRSIAVGPHGGFSSLLCGMSSTPPPPPHLLCETIGLRPRGSERGPRKSRMHRREALVEAVDPAHGGGGELGDPSSAEMERLLLSVLLKIRRRKRRGLGLR